MNLINNLGTSKEIKKEKAKILFQFTLMLVASVVCGICFSQLLSENTLFEISKEIQLHFSSFFGNCYYVEDYLGKLLCLSSSNLISILILFIFSFSFLNYIISDIIITFHGFCFGMNFSLFRMISFPQIGTRSSLLYLVSHFLLLLLLSFYAYTMALYSLKLRLFTNNGRAIVSKKLLFKIILFTLTILGTILIINGLYCLFIFLLK